MSKPTIGTTSDSLLLGQLAEALAALGSASVDGLTEAECLDVVTLLEATKGAAAALQAHATTRFVEQRDADARGACERGDISRREASCRRSATRAEVALARRCSPGQADRHVGAATTLVHDLPQTLSALTAGKISEWRATIVVRETTCLSPAHRAEVDRRLAPYLTTLGDRALTAAAHRACVDLDQAALVERRRRAAGTRRVSVRPAPDGMAYLSVVGPLVDVVGAYAALTAGERARHVATGEPEVDTGRASDDRGRGAWMADTALERLSGRSEGQLQRVEVALVMSESAILPDAERPCSADGDGHAEVPGWGAVPAQTARGHLLSLLDAHERVWLRRLWASPDGRDLVAMESGRRLFTGLLRRFVELRDATCRVPWCDAPTRQLDHVEPFARGGATNAVNAMGTCQRHNLVKEEPGWSAEVVATGLDPGGEGLGGVPHTVRLTTPTGAEFTSVAAPLLGHGRVHRRDDIRPEYVPSVGRDWSPLEIYYDGLRAA